MSKQEHVTINGKRFPVIVKDGQKRFPMNRVVRKVLEMARAGKQYDFDDIGADYSLDFFTKDEMHEFYRLIGYSVTAFSEIFSNDEVSL